MFEAEWMLSVRHVISPTGPMHEQQGHTIKGAWGKVGDKLKKKKGRALQLLAEASTAHHVRARPQSPQNTHRAAA